MLSCALPHPCRVRGSFVVRVAPDLFRYRQIVEQAHPGAHGRDVNARQQAAMGHRCDDLDYNRQAGGRLQVSDVALDRSDTAASRRGCGDNIRARQVVALAFAVSAPLVIGERSRFWRALDVLWRWAIKATGIKKTERLGVTVRAQRVKRFPESLRVFNTQRQQPVRVLRRTRRCTGSLCDSINDTCANGIQRYRYIRHIRPLLGPSRRRGKAAHMARNHNP